MLRDQEGLKEQQDHLVQRVLLEQLELKGNKDLKVSQELKGLRLRVHKVPKVLRVTQVLKDQLGHQLHVTHIHSVTSVLILLRKLVVLGVVLGVLLNTRHVQHLL